MHCAFLQNNVFCILIKRYRQILCNLSWQTKQLLQNRIFGASSYSAVYCSTGKKTSVGTSPVRFPERPFPQFQSPISLSSVASTQTVSASPVTSSAISSNWSPAASAGSKYLSDDSEELILRRAKDNILQNLNVKLCEQDSMYYLGVPRKYFDKVVFKLASFLKTDVTNVIICLRKIRLNPPFKELGYDFQKSESAVSKVFEKYVPLIACYLSSLIFWPDQKAIKKRLPINFRARFSNIVSIIDCFEIEVQKPSDPVQQTLTWSHYKKCNTMKYLISSTPDGLNNFVSDGFGGKTSDLKITELSGYFDVLPPDVSVMADRGFKGIAKHLEKKNCALVRPPSVETGKKSSKDEVKLSKRVASLRIHIERVIRRAREFDFVKPHACVNHNHIKFLDFIVKIVCGLVNLQEPIMKMHV